MMHLALISLGNLVCSWIGLLWKEGHQRRQYSTRRNREVMDSLPESSLFAQQTKMTSETTHVIQNAPIQVPIVRRIK